MRFSDAVQRHIDLLTMLLWYARQCNLTYAPWHANGIEVEGKNHLVTPIETG